MRRMEHKSRQSRNTILLSGWLFADLLLGLAVIFLVADHSIFKEPPKITPTAQITPTPTVTPTPIPHLETAYVPIELTADTDGIDNNSADAINNLKDQIRGRNELKGRSVGLAIVYTGSPTTSDDDISRAQRISQKVMDNVLKSLASEGPVFQRAAYYDPLFYLHKDKNLVLFHFYLFAQ